MSITIELAQEEETLIRAVAGQQGVDPATYVTTLIRHHLSRRTIQDNESPATDENEYGFQRVGNLHRGNFQISDDFDEPLPDEFWLGEG